MKQQTSFRRATIALSVILATTMIATILIFPSNEARNEARNEAPEALTTEMVERSITITIDGRIFLVHANVSDYGPNTEDYIREIMNSVARYFSVLEWSEDRPVEVLETENEIIATWPLPPELEALDAHKPDYTARAFLDRSTKEVQLFVGG